MQIVLSTIYLDNSAHKIYNINKNKGVDNMENIEEKKAIKNREAVKKCMQNKDRINVILPKGTIEKINSYGLKTNAFARELILAELERMDRMKK